MKNSLKALLLGVVLVLGVLDTLVAAHPALAGSDRPLTEGHPFDLGKSLTATTNRPTAIFSVAKLKDVLTQISNVQSNTVGQLQTINALANQPFPGSTSTPPLIWDPYAAACMPPLINFIQTTPTSAAIPIPQTGATTGPLVTLYEARLAAIGLDAFANDTAQRGFPASLQIGCAGFIQDLKNLPVKLGLDMQANMLALLSWTASLAKP